MNNFIKRKDRFEFFNSFENPLLNLTFKLETEDFLTHCKSHHLPPFHFFLFHLFEALKDSDNFLYRIYQGQVMKVEHLIPSYTVMAEDNLFNYTRFEYSPDINEFIRRSLQAKAEAEKSKPLINTGVELDERTLRNYVFITCIPWLDFTSIQHPVFKYKSADIPSIAWGKFTRQENKILIPFSLQAHHGFVDAFHMHQLAESLKARIKNAISAQGR